MVLTLNSLLVWDSETLSDANSSRYHMLTIVDSQRAFIIYS